MKKYYVLGLMLTMLFVSLSLNAEDKKENARKIDVGVLADPKFKMDWYLKRSEQYLAKLLAAGMSAEKVNADIFLSQNKDKREQYKRIAIFYYYLFSPEMYSGMEDYVKNGGLLITNSYMNSLDMNGNYVYDKNIDKEIDGATRLHGIDSYAAVQLQDITPKIECPLTKGLEKGQAIKCPCAMSETKGAGATVVITGTAFRRNGQIPIKEMPVIAFKQMGNGSIIYLGPPDQEALFKNCFSNEVLEWLTNN